MAYLHTTLICKVRNLQTGNILPWQCRVNLYRVVGGYVGQVTELQTNKLIGYTSGKLISDRFPNWNGDFRIVAGTITYINEKTIEDWKNGLRVR